jgi:DcmR-like sensory protein
VGGPSSASHPGAHRETSRVSAATHSHPRERGFHHEALLYTGLDGFVEGTLPFVREGLEADEPVLVAVSDDRIDLLRRVLGSDAARVRWVDMTGIGGNPARIIPLWRQLVASGQGGAVRGIGEPVWRGRSPEALGESQRHEELLNLAFAETPGLRILCPYDAASLDPAVLEEAGRSHPWLLRDGVERASERYAAPGEAFDAPLAPPPAGVSEAVVEGEPSPSLFRSLLDRPARRAGLSSWRVEDLALALTAAATSLTRRGGRLSVRTWAESAAVVSEIRSPRRIADPLAGREWPPTDAGHGRGLWVANQLCDLLQLRSSSAGTVVRLHQGQPE